MRQLPPSTDDPWVAWRWEAVTGGEWVPFFATVPPEEILWQLTAGPGSPGGKVTRDARSPSPGLLAGADGVVIQFTVVACGVWPVA
jgi:hypothetical protein